MAYTAMACTVVACSHGLCSYGLRYAAPLMAYIDTAYIVMALAMDGCNALTAGLACTALARGYRFGDGLAFCGALLVA